MDELESGKIEELGIKVSRLLDNHEQLKSEINTLKKEIEGLRPSTPDRVAPSVATVQTEVIAPVENKPIAKESAEPKVVERPLKPAFKKEKTQWEEFIGTNLLNKIGIVILVIGVSYGVKYSIDHNLLSPITRVILGYVAGLALAVVALRIKPNYKTFSAVLLSGAMATFYFITYAAYDIFGLMPQAMAFVLMVLFTGFTVFAAVNYDQKVIAIIGLVGAYAVPFLLSDGSGRVLILFSYVTIVNVGILVLAFKKDWKPLYYLAFGLTWLIYAAWFMDQFDANQHLWISLSFALIYFAIFYITFLAYKLVKADNLLMDDIAMLVFNSFLFYTFGYSAITAYPTGDFYLGIFTVFNAVLHFIACFIIYKKQDATRDTFFLVAGMVLVFLTLAVPVQLDGNWVTLTWAAEAFLLFWIGRTKQLRVYEWLSYVLIIITAGSLAEDWRAYSYYSVVNASTYISPFFNIYFFTSIFVLTSLGLILRLSRDTRYLEPKGLLQQYFTIGLSTLVLCVLYISFYHEVSNFWQTRFYDSSITLRQDADNQYPVLDGDLLELKTLWLLIYSAIFGIVLTVVNKKWLQNSTLTMALTAYNALVLLLFVLKGLPSLGDLRTSYVMQIDAAYFVRDAWHIIIRYISLLAIIPLVYLNRQQIRQEMFNSTIRQGEFILFHIFVLILLSSEVVHWLELAGIDESFKLWLSILWGVYALAMIVFGLKRNDKPLRTLAIVLFGITLLKLFFYDMADMSTIAKTIVMIILGVLLLISSFLYNKVKKATDEKVENEQPMVDPNEDQNH
ncbi:MAG: DUF2339 domain-containing protein [Cyclobacteriaceae bacterium]|nr:DUF2339 domain-containing protein [Cyclobacteriaceae bacterium]